MKTETVNDVRRRREGRQPTLADLAVLCQVSPKTVSRVVNGEKHVSEETRRRVLRAAQDLDFRPNSQAAALARGTTVTTVGLVVADMTNPFYYAVARGIEQALHGHGHRLVVASSQEDPQIELDLLAEFAQTQARAVLLVSTLEDHSQLSSIQAGGTPLIFLDRPPVNLTADTFMLDSASGVKAAIRQFLEFGHRRIGYVGDYPRLATHRERFTAFSKALREAGIDPNEYTAHGAHDAVSAEQLTDELLGRSVPPTALFAANNRISVGVLTALRRLDTQIAFIGFDDFELAGALQISTVRHDPVALGRAAARRALSITRADLAEGAALKTLLPCSLVPRGSGERPPPS